MDQHALVGQPLPPLTLEKWIGEECHPNTLRGSVVVLVAFAAWCKHCMREIPENNELADAYRHLGVQVVGVCATSGSDDLPDLLRFRPARYPIAIDVDDKSMNALKVRNFSEYFVIDRQQIVQGGALSLLDVESLLEIQLAGEGQD